MEDIISNVILNQNKELLQKIANDNYDNDEDKATFIQKYNKLNYTLLLVVKKDMFPVYEKRLKRIKHK
jgi:hypothetical protein